MRSSCSACQDAPTFHILVVFRERSNLMRYPAFVFASLADRSLFNILFSDCRNLKLKASSTKFPSGTEPQCFRLVVQATSHDGLQDPAVHPKVSEPFVVSLSVDSSGYSTCCMMLQFHVGNPYRLFDGSTSTHLCHPLQTDML